MNNLGVLALHLDRHVNNLGVLALHLDRHVNNLGVLALHLERLVNSFTGRLTYNTNIILLEMSFLTHDKHKSEMFKPVYMHCNTCRHL